jgi:hypothetical protein
MSAIATTITEVSPQVVNDTPCGEKAGRITLSMTNFTPYDDTTVAVAKTAAPETAMTKYPL